MNTKKLNCTRDKWRHRLPGIGSLLALLLVAVLLAAPALAANDSGAVPQAVLQNKPEVTIQGNVVVDDNGAPTGFYELALCVRSPRRIYGPDPAVGYATGSEKDLSEAEYARALADIEAGTAIGVSLDDYTVTYYPFSAASAVVSVNTDVLTAVHWDVTNVTYSEWLGSAYADFDTGYPRGIDLTANVDPEVWTPTDPDPFPDVTQATLQKPNAFAVALDAEGDRSAFTAAAQVEQYYENPANSTKAAILTLSAHAPDNKPVVYKTSTPVAVVRFAYDLKRFPKSVVMVNGAYNAGDMINQITGDSSAANAAGFWLGKDRATGYLTNNGKTPLTWLADTAMDTAGAYSFSDGKAAATEAGQVVWTKLSSKDTAGAPVDWNQTEYYYYLGANGAVGGSNAADPDGTISVATPGGIQTVEHVRIPDTKGVKILAPGSLENPTPGPGDSWTAAEYSYYVNILHLDGPAEGRGLRLEMVNAPTFKKPTGVSGPQILFYDWDDTLIGSLMVTKGDVRAQVNAYLEKTLVHPDLRSNSAFMADESGSGGMSQEEKYASLDREYTYRGKYAYTVGGDDATLGVEDGKEYPLTNKLDYVFTKRVNTSITQTESGGQVQYVRPYSLDDPELDAAQEDGALYPWVYGWAVVEDARAFNGKVDATGTPGQWKVMHDAAKLEDVWTTMGVGELSNMTNAVMTNSTLSTVGAVDPAAERNAPYFLADADPAWTDGTRADANDYLYTLEGQNRYLRFADFSDITTEMERYNGKDTLIVKAVYEPGPELLEGYNYQMIKEPYYNKLNAPSAAGGGAYSVEITLERASEEHLDGMLRGVNRVRLPAVRQDTTVDQKWIEDLEAGIKHDLANPSIEIAKSQTETTFTKVDVDNGEEVTFTLSLSARQNKVDYWIIETYGDNFVTGGQRSETNYNRKKFEHTIDNYYYYTADANENDAFFDQQNLYYQAVRYDVRDGTHGFILYGTLNYLMQRATMVNRGDITNSTFNANAVNAVFNDVNLRVMSGGVATVPTTIVHQNTIATALKNAAADCEKYHYGDPDFWNNELDCAELTYHQLQHYIMGKGLMTRAAADGDKFTWCHLHKDCFVDENAAQIPTNWEELIAAARSEDPEVQDAIGMLTSGDIGTIEEIAGLRTKNTGDYFTSASDFKNQIIRAVSVLDGAGIPVNWPTVQYYMLTGTAPASEQSAIDTMKASYWWYDGVAVRTTPGSLSALSAASQDYFNDVTLKDGVTHHGGFTAKMAPAKTVFDINAGVGENEASAGWIGMTRNLVKAYENFDNVYDDDGNVVGTDYGELDGTGNTTKFISYTEFSTYWLGFQGLAREIGLTAEHEQYWELIQYYVLQITAGNTMDAAELQRLVDVLADPSHADHAGLIEEFNGYWWKDGSKRLVVSNVRTLLTAARQKLDGGDPGPFDRVSWTVLSKDAFNFYQPNPGVGAPYVPFEESQMDAMKDSVLKAAADPNVKDWQSLQYYLIHEGEIDSGSLTLETDVVVAESRYYWWRNGGTGTVVDIAGASALADKLNRLMQALLQADGFGDPKALDQLKAADSIFTLLRLVKADPTGDDTVYTKVDLVSNTVTKNGVADTPEDRGVKYTSVDDLLADISGLYNRLKTDQGITNTYTAPSGVDWDQAQYWVLTGNFIAPGDAGYKDVVNRHWWYNQNIWEKIAETKDPEATEALWDAINTFYEKNMTTAAATTLKNKLTIALLNSTYKIRMDNTGAAWTAAKLNPAKLIFVELAKDAQADYYKDWEGDGSVGVRLTWAQMQVYFATSTATATKVTVPGDLLTPEAALDRIVNQWGWTVEGGGGAKAFIPEWVDLSGVSGASLFALDIQEGDLNDVTEATVPETVTPEDIEDIQARIEAMERELEALKKQLAAMETAQEKPETDSAAAAPLSPASTSQQQTRPAPSTVTPATQPEPETPETSEPPAEPEPAPVVEDHDERVEIPVGDEAAWTAAGTPAVMRATTLPPTVLDDPGLRPKYILVRRA